jgi:Beta propeller domain
MVANNSSIPEKAMEEGKQLSAVDEVPPSSSKKSVSSKVLFAGLVFLVVVAALAVGLGVGLSNRNNNNNSNQKNSKASNQSGTDNTEPPVVVEKVRISDATTRSLALISSKSLQNTYLDCGDLVVDLRKLAQLIANKTIQSNLGSSCYFNETDCPMIYYASPMEGDMASSTAGGQKSDSVVTTESSYGTNNQVEGVEEPDIVQSDGKNIFLAYGTEVNTVCLRKMTIYSHLLRIVDRLSRSVSNHKRLSVGRRFQRTATAIASPKTFKACS